MNSLQEIIGRKEELHPELMDFIGNEGFICLKHPLVFGVPYFEPMNAMYNEQFKFKKEKLEEYKKEKNWVSYVFLHEKPYRFQIFHNIKQFLSDEDYWEILSTVYQNSENLWQTNNLKELLNSSRPYKEKMMDEPEKELFNALPDIITVYRGNQGKNKKGFSWTLSYSVANFFANRFCKKGQIIQAKCYKKDIHAVLLGRCEQEVITEKVYNTKPIRVKIPEWFKSDLFHSDSKIHGFAHWTNVYLNVCELCKKTNADPLVCKLFAFIHDSKRENDGKDPEHGKRAASYAEKLYNENKLPVTKNQLDKLINACFYHNEGTTSIDPTIGTCFDCDRLDLLRVGIIPNVKYFSTQAGKEAIFNL